MVRIIEAQGALLDEAEKLIKKVFPWMDLSEQITFWAYRRRSKSFVCVLMRLCGVSSLSTIWVAVNDNGDVCGTTGFYTTPKDKTEASWLSWFCVDPKQRGLGIGKILLNFSIDKARESNKRFLRLYTSDDPNEAAAQGLYEKHGFKIIKKKKYISHTILYRELILSRRSLRQGLVFNTLYQNTYE